MHNSVTVNAKKQTSTQAGVGVHCRQSQVITITEYMENTRLPTYVDIWNIDRFVIFFAFVDYVYCIFGGHLIYLKLCGCVLTVISAPANVLGRLQCQARWNIVLVSYNLTVACHICVQPTVDYIGVPRTVGVVWVCRRFDKNNTPSMQLSTKPAKRRRTVYGQNGDKPKQHLQF